MPATGLLSHASASSLQPWVLLYCPSRRFVTLVIRPHHRPFWHFPCATVEPRRWLYFDRSSKSKKPRWAMAIAVELEGDLIADPRMSCFGVFATKANHNQLTPNPANRNRGGRRLAVRCNPAAYCEAGSCCAVWLKPGRSVLSGSSPDAGGLPLCSSCRASFVACDSCPSSSVFFGLLITSPPACLPAESPPMHLHLPLDQLDPDPIPDTGGIQL